MFFLVPILGIIFGYYAIVKVLILFFLIMAKKKNHEADIQNPNKGTKGTNKTYDKNQGNKGKQLNPTQHNPKYKRSTN